MPARCPSAALFYITPPSVLRRNISQEVAGAAFLSVVWLEMASIAPPNFTIFPLAVDRPRLEGTTSENPAVLSPVFYDTAWEAGKNEMRVLTRGAAAQLVEETLLITNALASAKTRSGLCFEPGPTSPTSKSVRDAALVSSRFRQVLEDLEGPTAETMQNSSATVLRSMDTLAATTTTTVRPYESGKLNVVKAGHAAVPLGPLLDVFGQKLLSDPSRILLPDEATVDSSGLKLYTDPLLKNKKTLLPLVLNLAEKNLITFVCNVSG